MPRLITHIGEHAMRITAAICFTLLLFLSALAQDKVKEQVEDVYSIQLVKESVKNPEMALGFSVTEKHINWLGDGVSIALLKIYDQDGLKDPQNIKNYLPIVRAAFVAPHIVRLPEDRKPMVTMFLLTYLEANVTDANLKVQISDAVSYVREQTSKE
jgi:hypothetical protein